MTNKVKMIWDFYGPNATQIAAHHYKHLVEFAEAEGIENVIIDSEKIQDSHHIAFMVVNEVLVPDLRAKLKPNRGQRYSE